MIIVGVEASARQGARSAHTGDAYGQSSRVKETAMPEPVVLEVFTDYV
jgi:hypothetical protein